MNIYSIFGPTINYRESNSTEQNTNPMNFLSSIFSREFNDLFHINPSSSETNESSTETNGTSTDNTTQTSPNIEEVIFYYNDLQTMSSQNGIPLNEMRNISTIETMEEESDEICVICHQPITNQQIIRKLNGCSHKFHIHCIDEWLSSNSTCPTCRRELIESSEENTTRRTTSTLPIYQFRYGRDRTRS